MESAELVAILHEVRDRVRARNPESGGGDAKVALPDLMPLVHARDGALGKVAAIGSVNPRPGGIVNSLVQGWKRFVSRVLDWHVREQVEFNRKSIACIDAAIESFSETNRALLALGSRIAAQEQIGRDLTDIRNHWAEWRVDWENKLARNEMQFLRSVVCSTCSRRSSTSASGCVCFVLVTRIDHRTLRAWAPWVYLVSLAGLVLVLSPVGSTVNGSRSWIQLPGGFSVQPSEFVKVALCVGLAMILAERRDRDQPPSARDLVLAGVVTLVPVGLVLLQPDLGSALVLVAMAFGVVAVAGAPKRLLLAVGCDRGRRRCGDVHDAGAERLPARPAHGVPRPVRRSRRASATRPGRCGSRSARAGGSARGCSRGRRRRAARSRSSRPTSCSRWRGRSGGSWALRASSSSSCSSSCGPCSWVAQRPVRAAGLRGRRRVVRGAGVREHRDEPRDHAGHRPPAAVPLDGGSSMFAAWLALGLVNNVHLAGTAHRR